MSCDFYRIIYIFRKTGIAVLLALIGVVAQLSDRTLAQSQIVPDKTLGSESSVVTPNVVIRGCPCDRIDGGAIRGANLFHSFQDFNVKEGRGVYFTNPQGIENILSRVTGANRSEILGRLGVLGNANLFLLNPNGIVFGQNASLDVEGSFFATTAEAIALGKQGYFSATQPQQSSLLSVSPGALFFNQAAAQPGNIINRGNLATPKDLTLAAGNLDLQGQFYAGGNLTLQATDTVKIRDSVASPFLLRSGGNLAIIGNQGIDILALNHPTQTPFVSGGNLSLISDGIISGDARFSSGGNFSIHNLSGELANFVSKYDPIISSNGDVDVTADYTGSSLLVESKGNIRFGGDINITTPDTNAPAGQDTATLSNSTALIIRSGQNTLAYGGVNSGSVPGFTSGTMPQGITLGGNVSLQRFNGTGGLVSLTAASGDVNTKGITTNGGRIDINSAGAIATTGILNSSYSPVDSGGNAGAIALTSVGNITTGILDSEAEGTGDGGNITLTSLTGAIDTTRGFITSEIRQGSNGTGRAGTIVFTAKDNIQTAELDASAETGNGSNIQLTSVAGKIDTTIGTLYTESGTGNAGAIFLEAFNNITTSRIISETEGTGDGGNITLTSLAGAIDTTRGFVTSEIRQGSNGSGRAGTIVFKAKDNIQTAELDASAETGNGSNIQLTSNNGGIDTTIGTLYTESGSGDGGAIALTADGNISTAILDSQAGGTTTNGGNISLISRNGGINTTGELNANTRLINSGNGGKITLQAKGDITTTRGMRSDGGTFGTSGDITITSDTGTILLNGGEINSQNYGTSEGGDISITATAGSVFLRNGAQLNASTLGQGNAGNVVINARDRVSFDGVVRITSPNGAFRFFRSGAFSNVEQTGVGKGGNIQISADSVSVTNGAVLSANTSGQGDAGNVVINARDRVSFDGVVGFIFPNGAFIPFRSGAFSNVQQTGVGKGGNIQISADSVSVTNGAQLSTSTNGQGNAGNVVINARNEVSFDGVVGFILPNDTFRFFSSGAFSNIEQTGVKKGGNIQISGDSVSVTNSAELNSSITFGGRGQAGDITIKARDLVLFDGGFAFSRLEKGGSGSAGDISITTDGSVRVTGISSNVADAQTGQLVSATFGEGNAGSITIKAGNNVEFDGRGSDAYTLVAGDRGVGNAGNITIDSQSLSVINGARLVARTENQGNAGNVNIIVKDSVSLNNGFIDSLVSEGAVGKGGDINIRANSLSLTNRARINADTNAQGNAGQIEIKASDFVSVSGRDSGLFTYTTSNFPGGDITVNTPNLRVFNRGVLDARTINTGKGGNINITSSFLTLNNGEISALAEGRGDAGSITIDVNELLRATNSKIITSATQSSGGAIAIQAALIRLYGNSDITTNVGTGTGGGGDINLTADSIIAFDDSDILTFASGGEGGNITLNTPAFFGQNYQPAPTDTDPRTLDGNNRVDVNASGVVSGVITVPDTSFIQNSLSELPQNPIDTSNLIANSCIARSSRQQQGSFTITGSGGLPTRPGDALMSQYTFGNVRSVSNANSTRSRWQKGDPIVEPQGVYRLSSGQLVLSRECP